MILKFFCSCSWWQWVFAVLVGFLDGLNTFYDKAYDSPVPLLIAINLLLCTVILYTFWFLAATLFSFRIVEEIVDCFLKSCCLHPLICCNYSLVFWCWCNLWFDGLNFSFPLFIPKHFVLLKHASRFGIIRFLCFFFLFYFCLFAATSNLEASLTRTNCLCAVGGVVFCSFGGFWV